MSEQRNLIIAFVLSAMLIFAWPYLTGQNKKQVALDGDGTVVTETGMPAAPPSAVAPGDLPSPGRQVIDGSNDPAVPVLTRDEALAAAGGRVRIENDRLHGSISLRGGVIDDVTLRNYHETVEDGSPEVILLSPMGGPNPYFAEFGWAPATQGVAVPDADTVWQADRTTLGVGQPVTLTWDNGGGLRFVRTIALDDNYMFSVTQTVENNGATPVSLYPFGRLSRLGTPPTLGFFILHEGPLGVLDGTLKEVDYDEIQEDKQIAQETTGGWIGITDKYWLTALVMDQTARVNTRFLHNTVQAKDNYQVDYWGAPVSVQPGATTTIENRLFAGAKELDTLSAYSDDLGIPQFTKAIDFGWFWFLTIPFAWALHLLQGWVGNMGVAILLFTVLLKLVFFPLANKSYVSMSKMKLLTPEIKALQERFKDDKPRINQEIMALYQKEKVNPLSGCMPILVQIPVFFALYKVIFVSLDLRHAPFFGWITDLSARESITVFNLFGLIPWTPPDFQFFWIGVLPLMMGFTMWFQQKLNPPPPDPTQAKIMATLPYIFVFVLAPFASGLILYWTWNNALSILQQWVIQQRLKKAQRKGKS